RLPAGGGRQGEIAHTTTGMRVRHGEDIHVRLNPPAHCWRYRHHESAVKTLARGARHQGSPRQPMSKAAVADVFTEVALRVKRQGAAARATRQAAFCSAFYAGALYQGPRPFLYSPHADLPERTHHDRN